MFWLEEDILALTIEDPEAVKMAERLRRLTGPPSNTETSARPWRTPSRHRARPFLAARIDEAVAMARRIGACDAEFDQKAFGDEM